jgi:hypothetical protein
MFVALSYANINDPGKRRHGNSRSLFVKERELSLPILRSSIVYTRISKVARHYLESLAFFRVLGTLPCFPPSPFHAAIFRALVDTAQGRFKEWWALIDVDKVLTPTFLVVGTADFDRLLIPWSHLPNVHNLQWSSVRTCAGLSSSLVRGSPNLPRLHLFETSPYVVRRFDTVDIFPCATMACHVKTSRVQKAGIDKDILSVKPCGGNDHRAKLSQNVNGLFGVGPPVGFSRRWCKDSDLDTTLERLTKIGFHLRPAVFTKKGNMRKDAFCCVVQIQRKALEECTLIQWSQNGAGI